jgi:hypothetical protein
MQEECFWCKDAFNRWPVWKVPRHILKLRASRLTSCLKATTLPFLRWFRSDTGMREIQTTEHEAWQPCILAH